MAGEVVSVNIHGGVCDAIFEWPGYPQITQEGDTIRLLEYGDHETSSDFCIYGVGTLVVPIGSYPPGNYSLTVDLRYDDLLGPTDINLGVIQFTVQGAAPAAPVPASSQCALLALLLLVSGLALWTLLAAG